jgi:hypothetical protein
VPQLLPARPIPGRDAPPAPRRSSPRPAARRHQPLALGAGIRPLPWR